MGKKKKQVILTIYEGGKRAILFRKAMQKATQAKNVKQIGQEFGKEISMITVSKMKLNESASLLNHQHGNLMSMRKKNLQIFPNWIEHFSSGSGN